MKSVTTLSLTLLLSLTIPAAQAQQARTVTDLSGSWHYSLPDIPDSLRSTPGLAAEGELQLPGTLDTNNVGIPVPPPT